MKKTNILVEVEDELYEAVVAPHKRSKTFSKLLSTLISGYAENEYVRAYAEGTLDEIQAESVNALDEVIQGMQGSLADMGLFTNELKNTNQAGAEAFSKQRSFRSENFGSLSAGEPKESAQEDTSELKSTVEELKAQNKEIMSMLERLMSSGSGVVIKAEPAKSNTAVHKKPVIKESVGSSYSEPLEPLEPLEPVGSMLPTEDAEEESSGSAINVTDVMSQLLSGNEMSF